MTVTRVACGLVLIATVVAGCTAPPPTPESVVIGVLAATSGPDPSAGEDAVRGAQLAIEIVNDAHPSLPIPLAAGRGLPGLRGSKLTLVTADTKAQADVAAAQTTALVEKSRALGVVVADSADVAAAAASETQRLRVPMLDACSTADYLTELGLDWYFRAGPLDRWVAESAFALLRRFPVGGERPRIALVTEGGGASAVGAELVKNLAVREGNPVAFAGQLGKSETKIRQLTDGLAASVPDAVFGWAQTASGAEAIGRIAGALAGSPPVIGLGKGFRQVAGPANGSATLLRAVPWSADLAGRNPTGLEVMKLYHLRYGRAMTEVAAATFTAVIALAVAIDAAATTDPAAIRTALRQASLPATQMIMPWDGVRFGSDGQNQLAAAVVEAWANDAFHVVFPAELASAAVPWAGSKAGA